MEKEYARMYQIFVISLLQSFNFLAKWTAFHVMKCHIHFFCVGISTDMACSGKLSGKKVAETVLLNIS